jgi:hypothetical protein
MLRTAALAIAAIIFAASSSLAEPDDAGACQLAAIETIPIESKVASATVRPATDAELRPFDRQNGGAEYNWRWYAVAIDVNAEPRYLIFCARNSSGQYELIVGR